MSKKLYWTQQHEDLCLKWQSATTQQEFYNIHKEILPAVNRMAEIILKRYFGVAYNREEELKTDAVQNVFLNLYKYKQGKSRSGAYSFCSLLIKNYYHDLIIVLPNWEKNQKHEYVDEFQEYMQPMEYSENTITQETYDRLIMVFEKKIKELETQKINNDEIRKQEKKKSTPIFDKQISMLNLAIQYIKKFNNCNPKDMVDYIMVNGGHRRHTVTYFFRKTWKLTMNAGFSLSTRDNDGINKRFQRVDDKYNYVQDDTPPAESIHYKRDKRKAMIKRIEGYQDYEYF